MLRRKIVQFGFVCVGAGLMLSAVDAAMIQVLEGEAELVAADYGAKAWSDRRYTVTEWPEQLESASIVRASIQGVRFEVTEPATVVVLTPRHGRLSQIVPLLGQGFEQADIAAFHPYRIDAQRLGNECVALQKEVNVQDPVDLGYYGLALIVPVPLPLRPADAVDSVFDAIHIPTLDISRETHRHTFVAKGTTEIYQGHVDTLLMPDGKTMFAAWAINHAGHLGPLARSDDTGLTWSDLIDVPANWWDVRTTTPTIHRLVDPGGVARLFVLGDRIFRVGCGKPFRRTRA